MLDAENSRVVVQSVTRP